MEQYFDSTIYLIIQEKSKFHKFCEISFLGKKKETVKELELFVEIICQSLNRNIKACEW